VLEYKRGEGASSLIRRVHVDAGQSYSGDLPESIWTIVSGKGILTILNEESVVSAGSVVKIPNGAGQSLLAATELELIEVQFGIETEETL
jgi:mannose-6-phosphate isomerase-like protein (cupin superfamily)